MQSLKHHNITLKVLTGPMDDNMIGAHNFIMMNTKLHEAMEQIEIHAENLNLIIELIHCKTIQHMHTKTIEIRILANFYSEEEAALFLLSYIGNN